MDKALEIGKISAIGSFHLFLGGVTSTCIMALGVIVLAQVITPQEYGLYSVSLVPSYMIALFRDWGINAAVTKFIATFKEQNRKEEIYRVVKAGIAFEITLGLTLTIIALTTSNFIATVIFKRPEVSTLMVTASITIFIGALLTVSQSSFIGFERMEFSSLMNICQAVTKTMLSPVLVLIGFRSLGAVIGYTASLLVAATLGLTLLYIMLNKNSKTKIPRRRKEWETLETLKEMLRYGIPFSVSSIIGGFLTQFYAFLMAIYCADTFIGNYHVAVQFATILTFFTIPILTALFPAFSKINPQDENNLLQTVFHSAVKYTAMLIVPVTMAVMVLSKQMISILFGEKWVYAPTYLMLYAANNLFVIFGGPILGNLLAGIGETKMLMKLSLTTLACGIPMAYILIPSIGIIGLIITQIVAGFPGLALGLYMLWRRYRMKVSLKENMRILAASTIAAIVAFLVVNVIASSYWIELLFGCISFFVIYILTVSLTGAVKQVDIKNLKLMFSGLGLLSKLINIPLNIIEEVVNVVSKKFSC